MKKWEYKVMTYDEGDDELKTLRETLNNAGHDGWEAIQIQMCKGGNGGVIILKREINN